jgi:hypothetical protein
MRAHEFITEGIKNGWGDQVILNLPNNMGKIIIGERYEDFKVVEAKFLYYGTNESHHLSDEITIGIIVKNGNIFNYNFMYPNGKLVGQFTTIDDIKKYFNTCINNYLTGKGDIMEEISDNKNLDINKLCPELDQILTIVLSRYGTVPDNSLYDELTKLKITENYK